MIQQDDKKLKSLVDVTDIPVEAHHWRYVGQYDRNR